MRAGPGPDCDDTAANRDEPRPRALVCKSMFQSARSNISVVIAGLDPAIHLFAKLLPKKIDPRVKPGGDTRGFATAESNPPERALVSSRVSRGYHINSANSRLVLGCGAAPGHNVRRSPRSLDPQEGKAND